MYKHCYKAQKFVNHWTDRMGLKRLDVTVSKRKTKLVDASISLEDGNIILYKKAIPNRMSFVYILLHEVCHWWYFQKFGYPKGTDEKRVIILSLKILKRYYPSYFKIAIRWAVEFVKDFDLCEDCPEHYYGHLDALKKYGASKDVKKVTA